jgi:prepilin-type N-terminal cleavage/methylation domain-containing protein/prepilin-type processing-associated H-X9-DG protein
MWLRRFVAVLCTPLFLRDAISADRFGLSPYILLEGITLMASRRSAFTLIELLVVIAIIAILIGLLLPAVQKVREAGYRVQCENNLKQIALAVHTYHDSHLFLPPGKGTAYPAPNANYARWSFLAYILPFIEQGNVYDAIDFNFPPETPGMAGAVAFMPPWSNPGGQNHVISRTKIKTFLCPSDINLDETWPGQTNYVGNLGSQFLCDLSERAPSTVAPKEYANGVFYYLSHLKLTDIVDGTSQTAMLSEKLRGNTTPDPQRSAFVMPAAATGYTLAGTYTECTNNINPMTALTLTNKQGYSWVMGEMCCTLYNHVSTPNTRTCAGTGFATTPTLPFPWDTMTNMPMQVPPSSQHGQGVNVAMCDGDVRYISDSVSITTWRALGTRNGQDVPGPDW